MTIALVDGDIVCYRSAASCEPNLKGKTEREPLHVAIARCDDLMNRILNDTASNQHSTFISGPDNFRYAIDPLYKANRKDKVRPEWLQDIREHLVVRWGAHVSDGIEADDDLGIAQTDETVICSIDKDLLQIPGRHYNFVSGTHCIVDELGGWMNFYTQLVMGDRADNIPGYDGKMRQAVPNFLRHVIDDLDKCEADLDMYSRVYDLYENEGLGVDRFKMNCELLYILREPEQFWSPPY